MRLILPLLLIVLLTGCGSGVFKVSKAEYRQQVQTLGVLPILVDEQSPITHSQREEIVELLRRSSAGKAQQAIDRLKQKKGYFDVRFVAEDPQRLVRQLLVSTVPSQRADGLPAGYRYAPQVAEDLAARKVVDGLLVVVLAGVEHKEKRWSRTKLETLTTDYNDIMATAAVIDRQGQVLWQMTDTEALRFLLLQYPDFDEAFYHRTDRVALKEVTLAGLERALAVPEAGDGAKLPAPFAQLFDRLASSLSPSLFDPLSR